MKIFSKTEMDSRWRDKFRYEHTTGRLFLLSDGSVVDAVADDSYAELGAPDLLPGCLVYVDEKSDIPVHRIIWRMANGPIERGLMVKHKNGDLTDNRLRNLTLTLIKPKGKVPAFKRQKRVCTKPRKDNSTGYLGVIHIKRTGKYLARITVDGVRYDLGHYRTAEQASAAYQEAKKRKEKA